MTTVERYIFANAPTYLWRASGCCRHSPLRINPQWQECVPTIPLFCPCAPTVCPPVLVNGSDVAGMEPSSDNADACRYTHTHHRYRWCAQRGCHCYGVTRIHAAEHLHAQAGTALCRATCHWPQRPKLACPACWPAYSGR